MKKRSLYIVTKPLQYINASNIDDNHLKDIAIIPWFTKSKSFVRNVVKKADRWSVVYEFNTRNQALSFALKNKHMYEHLYIDSDWGIFLTILFFLLKPIRIFTYEEGWASYYTMSWKKSSLNPIKYYSCRLFFHWKNYIGGGCFTNGVFLYNPSCLIKNIRSINKERIFRFKSNFTDHVNSLYEFDYYWSKININHLNSKNILIYLTTWPEKVIDFSFTEKPPYADFVKIIKYHPHIQGSSQLGFPFVYELEREIPVEVYLTKLLCVCNEIIVMHHNSSVTMYIQENSKLKYINLF